MVSEKYFTGGLKSILRGHKACFLRKQARYLKMSSAEIFIQYAKL